MTPVQINKAEGCQALLLLPNNTRTQENAEIQEGNLTRNYRQVKPAEDLQSHQIHHLTDRHDKALVDKPQTKKGTRTQY